MNRRITIVRLGALPVLLGGFLVSTPAIFADGANSAEQAANRLLSDAKTQAFQIKEDAATMESFNWMTVSRETQAATINQIRDDVNALVRTEVKLQGIREDAPAWQRTVINRIVPFLDELNGYTSAVIEHLNGQTPHTFAEYRDYLEANADYSADLAKMIADYVDYGRTKDRMERLTNKLEISAR